METTDIDLIACQLVSSPDIDDNFDQIEAQLQHYRQNADHGPALVVLPESFALFGGKNTLNLEHQEPLGDGPIQQRLAKLAIKYEVWLAGGTIPTTSHRPDKFMATLAVFNPKGELVAHYQKIHLFDVDVADNTGAYRESDTTVPGERIVLFDLEGITVGLAVCYDVRFPGLFQVLADKGAQLIVLPSAFTQPTGQAHWHVLLRARAIENQVYMVAAGQGGLHNNARQTYGHSLIVDPWGEILAERATGAGYVKGSFDRQLIDRLRQKMPIKQHNRMSNELNNEFSRT